MISYRRAVDIEERVKAIVAKTGLGYLDVERIRCVRSYGSASSNTAARIHSVSKAFLTGFGMKPAYVIEFIAEIFDKLPAESQDEIIIHELLHIPKSFTGGLLPHGRVDFRRETKTLKKMLKT
ncbi:MAG: putative metallopeptidase [Candidatus Caldarchaeum sp.]|nr:putative metallopeptidase [Candidatus Caldarchaeum sp.]MCS7133994.1 putative metallopeptidase [Candidatus Caldarchaeum sp.]MCX8200546.1 putative metallopeptidase [Candidatus Caldarchaeum sp.]MDW8063528.1 putative metallopeptidase [Candidatus Caldarchaeum sp.]MDW8434611.1 putative metallopeptidase [Candidatus Caldarchaeum sp.]